MTTEQIKSVCPYCGVGCGIVLEVSGGRIRKTTGDKQHPVNRGRLCTKGSTCAQAIAESGRLEHAFLRPARGAALRQLAMDEAIRETAGRLRTILDAHGPDALAFYVSGQMSLEAQYVINKLAKGFIRTNQIESNSRLCMASAGSGYKLSLGSDAPPGSYDDIDRTNLFFVIGANMADCHPILYLRMMDRVKAGAKLIVVDPRRTATADKADLFLQIKPGADLALLNGLLHLLLQSGRTDPQFIADFTAGWEKMPTFLDDYPPELVAELTGLPAEAIRQAAAWIGEAAEWMSCWTMGLNQSTHGTWHTNALCNLHLATGAICRPGSGPFSLTGQPNAMGGREMGYMGPGLPGQRSVLVEEERHFVEELWGVPRGTLRTETGSGTVALFRDMAAGRIKACWIICTNPAATVPNRQTVLDGLAAAEFVVAQDAFADTETNRCADMLLPGALWAEAEGVMINSERNLTLMQKAVEPPGEALADWQIIARVACEMGYADAFSYGSAADVYREIQQAWNPKTGYDLRGASYERLREGPVQWPCPPGSDERRHPIRYVNDGVSQQLQTHADGSRPRLAFATASGKANFFARPYLPPAEMPDGEFPFVLNTGRLQHQWHTLTKTGKIPTLNKLNPGPFIEIHPEDAAALGIVDQTAVEIRSRRGRAVLPAVLSDRVRPGTAFAPFHWNDVFGADLAVNAVTSDAVDPISLQPELKFCAVALTPVPVAVAGDPRDPRPATASRMADADPNQTADPVPRLPAYAGVSGTPQFQKEDLYMTKVDTLATMLGIESSSGLTLDSHEKLYIAGFITSLRTDESHTAAGVPVLPPSAPLAPSKRFWLDGVLAGMFSRTYLPQAAAAEIAAAPPVAPPVAPVAPVAPAAPPAGATQPALAPATPNSPATIDASPAARPAHQATIVWASQTGNAEGAALECAKRLQAAGHDVRVLAMDAYPLAELAAERALLLVASTFGAGDPPDNGAAFWQQLQAASAPRLNGLRFAVLGLGDSSYEQFCGFARRLEERLAELGARAFVPRTDCDTDFQEPAAAWTGAVHTALLAERERESAASDGPAPGYDRKQPLPARLLAARRLNGSGSEKDTRHYVLDLTSSGLHYEAGDALGVWPVNCPELVETIVNAVGLAPGAPVEVKGATMAISEALLRHYEIGRITPAHLQFVQQRAQNAEFDCLLQPDNKAELKRWLWDRQLADLLLAFPVTANAGELLAALKPLQPRLYSISSSSKSHPGEAHITVSTVRYSCNGAARAGVCSGFLADRATPETEIAVFVQRTSGFRPPADPDAPMIMVGPGTGIGPFRGFLQERKATGARGKNWLFFGEQRAACDFYFQEELTAWQREGHLHRLDTAFSRDQEDKTYVQHRMLEHGVELWRWLQDGAHFYVCGDASAMAKEVEAALKTIIRQHGGLSADETNAYVKAMGREKRYARDVY